MEHVFDALDDHLAFAYTSFSHTPECPRFRVVLPADRVIGPKEFPVVWEVIDRRLRKKGIEIDPACRDASRLWFWPAKSSDDFTTKLRDGKPLNVDELLADAPTPVQAPAKTDADDGKEHDSYRPVRSAHPSHLFVLTRECEFIKFIVAEPTSVTYQQWFAAGTILKAFPLGTELFHTISALDGTRYERTATEKMLGSIKGRPTHCDKTGRKGTHSVRRGQGSRSTVFLG